MPGKKRVGIWNASVPHLLPGLEELGRQVEITKGFQMPTGLAEQWAEKDVPLLAGAMGALCTPLWTSDRQHFGNLYGQSVHGVMIFSSIQEADQLMGDERGGPGR